MRLRKNERQQVLNDTGQFTTKVSLPVEDNTEESKGTLVLTVKKQDDNFVNGVIYKIIKDEKVAETITTG